MGDFNFLEFRNNLQKDFLDAQSLVNEIENVQLEEMYNHDDVNSMYYTDTDFNKERLVDVLDLIRLKIEFAYEFIGLNTIAEKLKNQLLKYEGKFENLEFIPYIDVFYSPVLFILKNHLKAITSQLKEEKEFDNTSSIMLLEQILRGTPKMLYDREIEPTNEAEVRNEVYKILIHVFPDTVREIPISKISKTYKPDIGVKKLKSAIEYKFINSLQEAKTAIGGVFEDVNGYAGSEDWTTFYAVFYMTDNFMTQDQIEAEFKLSKVSHKWKPLVVFGKGERKKKEKKIDSKPLADKIE